MPLEVQLTPRQQEILRHVVEEFVSTGQPVGSRTLVDRAGLDAAPSTVRAELAELESLGLLTHRHTSAGGVTKRLFQFEQPVDPGLAQWAGEYLNETVAGLQLGTSLLRRRFEDSGLPPRERAFLAALRPAFTELVSAEQRLYVGGAADLLGEVRAEELEAYRNLFDLVEKRAALLDVPGGSSRDLRRPFVRVGHDLDHPALREVALV